MGILFRTLWFLFQMIDSHESQRVTWKNHLGTFCWEIKPTQWSGWIFGNLLECLAYKSIIRYYLLIGLQRNTFYSKSNQHATGFLRHLSSHTNIRRASDTVPVSARGYSWHSFWGVSDGLQIEKEGGIQASNHPRKPNCYSGPDIRNRLLFQRREL